MNLETRKLDDRLRIFNTINAQSGFKVDSLRINQEKMNDQIQRFRRIIRKNNITINDQKNAIYWVAQKIDDHMELKKIISEKLHGFVKDLNQEKVDQDADIKKEYESQRNYLENCVKVLRKRQQAAAINSTNENKNIMEENRKWITMIGELTG